MQFNVAQLLKEPIGATRTYSLDESLAGLDTDLIPLSTLTGTLHLLRTHSGVLASGRFDVTVQADCGRCLEPVPAQIEVTFEESFRPLTEVTTGRFLLPDEFEGEEEDLEDFALIINDHHILDISEILRQSIWLGMPMIPRCVYADPENCPNFVERLNEMAEVHADLKGSDDQPAIDPRWAALLVLQKNDED
ncbi:MAG: DUF177 domain-containing protein [Caldilineaceae bacterium]|nr:DUF177 domain-containing protein [Caldilineaceae bacterium]HRJ43419.1 DUF177 domain-containing protein [Caldilineaceae bacterium]